jgi:general secretion pathway protein F
VERLQALGFVPVQVEEAGAGTNSGRGSLFSRAGVSQAQLGDLTRELSTLLRAGLPLDRALEILIGLGVHEKTRVMLTQIRDEVRGGAALSTALEAHPRVFGRFYVSMIKAGEAGGALGEVLARISEFMERAKELRETVKSALIYPVILLSVALLSVITLLIFVVPQFTQMFAESGKALPLPTQIVVASGNFLRQYWWGILLGTYLFWKLFQRELEKPDSRYLWDGRFLRLPLVGELITKIEIARFARTLGTLIGNGIPLLGALAIVKDTIGNRVIARGLDAVQEKLKAGHGFGKPLMEHEQFPKLAVHMVLVGEETGQLDTMLTRIADVFDREVQMTVKRLLALLEPVMILGLGLVIGGIIMSILLAILEANSLVG